MFTYFLLLTAYKIKFIIYLYGNKSTRLFMKYLLASDIHGSYKYACALKNAVMKHKPDKICLLGDYYYHGPRNPLPEQYDTMATAKVLNSLKDDIIAVRGNCDSDVDIEISEFTINQHFCLPYNNGRTIYLTHGDHYNEHNLPPLKSGDILCCGHFHLPYIKFIGTNTVINPGSISLSKNGTNTYAVIDDEKVTFYDADGNFFADEILK